MSKAFGSSTSPDDSPREKSAHDRAIDSKAAAQAALELKRTAGQRVADLVRQQIVAPLHFLRVDGHHLYGSTYRVNVYVAQDSPEGMCKDLSIDRSYFVVSNGLEIMRSDPPLPSHREHKHG